MTVLTGQSLVYATCEPLRVFPPVAEEDLWPLELTRLDPGFLLRPSFGDRRRRGLSPLLNLVASLLLPPIFLLCQGSIPQFALLRERSVELLTLFCERSLGVPAGCAAAVIHRSHYADQDENAGSDDPREDVPQVHTWTGGCAKEYMRAQPAERRWRRVDGFSELAHVLPPINGHLQ